MELQVGVMPSGIHLNTQLNIQWVAAAFIHDVCAFNSDF